MEIVGQHFRPEFVNRIDDIVVFHPLDREQLRNIARIQLRYLRERLQSRDMDLELSDAAVDKLAAVGFDPVYGARPLKRAIQTMIENPLAQEILSGKFTSGDVIRIEVENEELVFTKSGRAAAQVA
jgi:ATP-dependent Clp protease ATP-binding subunit ClpB